jgi:uncharacterized protein involved in exopolysaccharide biosynthesis
VNNELVPASASPVAVVVETGTAERTRRLIGFTIVKWRWTILGVFLAFTLAAAIAAFFIPVARSATARVLLKGDRAALQVSNFVPPASRVPFVPQLLQSEVELIKSREVLFPVAQRLMTTQPDLATGRPNDLELLALNLGLNTVAVPVPETNVILVTHYANDANRALNTLRLLIDQYVEVHAFANSGSTKLLKFYEQERDRVVRDLSRHEEDLKQWREANAIVSIEAQITARMPVLADRERALRQTETDIQGMRAKMVAIEAQLVAQPERLVLQREVIRNPLIASLKAELASVGGPSQIDRGPLVTKLQTELVTAEVALKELLQRYTDSDRRVQEKREQIELLKRELELAETSARKVAERQAARLQEELTVAQKEGEIVGRETTSLNPLREELQRQFAAAQASLNALLPQQRVLETQVRELTTDLNRLGAKKIEEERLARLVRLGNDSTTLYTQKLEEARIAAGLDREQLANISVIEQPHVNIDVGIKRQLAIIGLAAFVGLALGFAIAFGTEVFNNSLRSADDTEYYLALPVLAVIPETGYRRRALHA